MESLNILYPLAKAFSRALGFSSVREKLYDIDVTTALHNLEERRLKGLHDLIRKPAFSVHDTAAIIDAVAHFDSVGIDDRQLLLEKLIVFMSRLHHLRFSAMLQKRVITLLYNDIPSPPACYLSPYKFNEPIPISPQQPYVFRSPDGSHYNPMFPSLGRAGMPYARSVPGTTSLSIHALPNPHLVFDVLLRREEFTPHPGGISSLFFAFANLIIHDLFFTNRSDMTINNTSSYLDLSILYGNSESEQSRVRRKDGTGRLWNDVFSDSRLLLMPPACGALLILLNRNHNHIARMLLEINESTAFVSPPPANKDALIAQDNELFHRARLINCGFFVQIILRDYVGAILGLVRDCSEWRLDPLQPIRDFDHKIISRGEGNVVSIEFNLLYRWHSAVSEQDTQWTEELFKRIFKKESSKISVDDFRTAISQLRPDPDIKKRTFGGLSRDQNGAFRDEDLARIIHDAIESPASSFKARGIPEVLRVVEVLGIEQSRAWGTCSLNEFRKFIGLKPYSSFSEWNSDPKIYRAAEDLYKEIDNLELYVGLQAEDAKLPGPGAGLCPGYTISRAILGDAVMLTRGDRYLNTEFTPFNLTAWGFNDCKFDPSDGSFGGMLTKLFLRTLPDYFPFISAYSHFPFLVPTFMKDNLIKTDLQRSNSYTWIRPVKPSRLIFLDTYDTVAQVIKNPSLVARYDDRISSIINGLGISQKSTSTGRFVREKLLSFPDFLNSWPSYFEKKVKELIYANSTQYGVKSRCVDVVRDVINLLPVHWISEEIIGLPLKTDTNTKGIWGGHDLYQNFADVGHYVFMNSHAVDDWHLLGSSQKTYNEIAKYIKSHIYAINSVFGKFFDGANDVSIASRNSHSFIRSVRDAIPDASENELCAYIFASVIPTSALYSATLVHIIDFYLNDYKRSERMEIVRLNSESNHKNILIYVYEALRLNPIIPGVFRTALKNIKVLGSVEISAGEHLYADISAANGNSNIFGNNSNLSIHDRSTKVILPFDDYGLLSSAFFESTAPLIVGNILSIKNLSRLSGVSGKFHRILDSDRSCIENLYINSMGNVTPFPESMVVQFET